MDILPYIIAVVVLLGGGLGTYVFLARKKAAKPIQNSAVLYNDWAERFGYEALDPSPGPAAAEANAKLLRTNLKLLWDGKVLEELDLRPVIPHLTQEDILQFVAQANELFLPEGSRTFIYDISDARSGAVRLFTVEKDSDTYKSYSFGQALIKLLKSATPLQEFPAVEFEEDLLTKPLNEMSSFVIQGSGLEPEPATLYEITSLLESKFGDTWEVFLVTDGVYQFSKAQEEEEIVVDVSPFAAQQKAKEEADAEAARKAEAEELERRMRWEHAEEQKRIEALAEQDRRIEAEEITPLVRKPLVFLAAAIEFAADEANFLDFDEEAYISKTDRIGSPLEFNIYSDKVVDLQSDKAQYFLAHLIASLERNFGGSWSVTSDETKTSVVTFVKSLL